MATDNEISTEINDALKLVLQELNITNYDVKIQAGSSKGDNYMGFIKTAEVKGKNANDENIEKNFILKCAPDNPKFREQTRTIEIYKREVFLYDEVLPIFEEFQTEKRVIKPFEAYAKFYKYSPVEFHEVIIMENMKKLGFKLQNRQKPLDIEHVMLVLKEYGKLHALSFALKEQKPIIFEKLRKPIESNFFAPLVEMKEFVDSFDDKFEKGLKQLDPVGEKHVVDAIKKFRDNIVENFKLGMDAKLAGEETVITHGDCWINNMLFKYENDSSQKPVKLCLLDWQLSCCASPAMDLSYFIFVCTDKATRDKYYDSMLKTYYDSFSSFLNELGNDPDVVFPRSSLDRHLKHFSLYGFLMALMVLPLILSDPDEIPTFTNSDLMSEETKNSFKFESRHEKYVESRLADVFRDFVRLEYL